MTFTNIDVDIAALPRFDATVTRRLDPHYAKLVLGCTSATSLLAILVATLIAFGIADATGPGRWWLVGLVVVLGSALTWFRHKAASVISYSVREHDVILRNGVFWKKETVQPIARVQHVERAQGPVEKRLGLARLKLFSAGTGHVTFEIPGLDADTALRIQAFILERKSQTSEGTATEAARDGPTAAEHA